jgi:hypothetical protein
MRATQRRSRRELLALIRLAAACTATLVAALTPATATAAIPGDCTELGVAITEHSCFHSEFGPFDTVMATAGSTASADTPNIDPIHTEYRIGLTGEYSVVTYTPRRSGAWAVLLGEDVPIQVLAGKAEALPSILEQEGTTGCDALPLLHVFELTAKTQYRFVFGPAANATVVAVVEYIEDFLTQNGRDADGDGFGGKAEVIVTPCKPPTGFAPNTRDCDDTDPEVNPSAKEACDGVDQNCNGVADDVGLVCHAGAGACRAQGLTACATGSDGATCAGTPLPGGDETCNGVDDDCNGKIDDADGLCPDPDRPTCVRRAMTAACGCLLDLDCGDANSGRICETKTGVCKQGCSPLPGRNGCPRGEVCDEKTTRCEPMTGAGDTGGSANVSGSGGGAGSSWPAGGAPSEGGEPSPTPRDRSKGGDGGGCGCRVTGQSRSGGGAAACLGVALSIAYVRRRRGAPAYLALGALAASSITGCAGRYLESPDGSSGSGNAAEGGSISAGTTSGGLPTLGGSSAGGVAGAAAGCVPALGDKLVAHACSHTTNGPFIPVVAGGSSEPADVSDLHRTFEVQMVGAGARLRYRAQRSGAHSFMTDVPAVLEVRQADRPLPSSPSFAIEGCAHLTHATVVELARGAEYDVAILESPPELDLFVEHVETFGNDGWKEPCDAALER